MTTTQLAGAGVCALLLLLLLPDGRSRGTKATRKVTRTTGSYGRALLAAGLIVAGQWVVITRYPSTAVLLVALSVPAVFAGLALARLLPITTTIHHGHKRGRRR